MLGILADSIAIATFTSPPRRRRADIERRRPAERADDPRLGETPVAPHPTTKETGR